MHAFSRQVTERKCVVKESKHRRKEGRKEGRRDERKVGQIK